MRPSPGRALCTTLCLTLVLAAGPALAQQGQGQVQNGRSGTRATPAAPTPPDPNCADTANRATAAASQNCAEGIQNPVGRDTSKGGNMGQRRNPSAR